MDMDMPMAVVPIPLIYGPPMPMPLIFGPRIPIRPIRGPPIPMPPMPCKFGVRCYNKDPAHLAKYLHPITTEDMERMCNFRPPCIYGGNCHRKDPFHFQKFFHPNGITPLEPEDVLTIDYKTPIYWGQNALSEPYLEVDVHYNSKEFRIISDLLNGTIGEHGNLYGTIYRKDPVELWVTKIKRIHSKGLWE